MMDIGKLKSYVKELTIVTIGVLVALLISNFKENRQAKNYYKASIETIENEVKSNYAGLKAVVEKQISLQDTLKKYSAEDYNLMELLLEKAGGVSFATLSNSGVEYYKNNQISSVDFEVMSRLLAMKSISGTIDTKMEKLLDYVYPNFYNESEESKKLVMLYMGNLLNSEQQLLEMYKSFIDDYIDPEIEELASSSQ